MIRVFSFTGLVWVHAGIQLLAYTLGLIGMGLGIWIGTYLRTSNYPFHIGSSSCMTCRGHRLLEKHIINACPRLEILTSH